MTEAAQIFISQDHNHIVGPIYYEGGYWFLNGERFAVEPGNEPEDPHAELYYYLDDQGNLKVELRTQGSDVALGALIVALAQGGTEGAPLPVINARVKLMPNQGQVRDVAVDGLVQYDFLKGQESNQPSLKDVLSQAGAGKVYLFEGEAQAGDPLDSEYEYSSENERHNKLLVDPELVGFLEDGRAGGIIWREAQGDFAQHYGGSDQMKALADKYDAEIFISSGHQFRNPASWTGSKIIKSEQDHYRGFVSLIKEMLKNYRNRYERQDNLNPIVIDRPLTQDGETGVIPRDKLSYEYAFEEHPQEDNAPGPMMETAAEAAPKGKNEEWGTKFAVYESLGLSREGRFAKLQGFFKKFGLDKADVPPRSYALIIDEFMLEEDFFTSETFLTRFNELQASNPNVRIIIALRPYGIWTRYATPEHIADAITPLLQLMADGKVDIGLGRTLLANPAIEARIRELAKGRR